MTFACYSCQHNRNVCISSHCSITQWGCWLNLLYKRAETYWALRRWYNSSSEAMGVDPRAEKSVAKPRLFAMCPLIHWLESTSHSGLRSCKRMLQTFSQTALVFLLIREEGWGRVHAVRRLLVGILYMPWMMDEYGAFCRIKFGRGSRRTWRKRTPLLLYPPQIPHDAA